MSTLDELLGRIDADLALPAFPPLLPDGPQYLVGDEQAAAAQLLPEGLPERAELLGECPPRPPEPPAVDRQRPQPSWWRRLFRRA